MKPMKPMTCTLILAAFLSAAGFLASAAAAAPDDKKLYHELDYTIAEAKTIRGTATSPEAVTGGGHGAFLITGENAAARLMLDLGNSSEVHAVRITTPPGNHHTFLTEVSIGSNPTTTRRLLGRSTNLPSWKEGGTVDVTLPADTVGRYLALDFTTGYTGGAVSKVALIGRKNIPERHLLYWAGDLDRDYRVKMDYLANDLGITDIWLDFIETAFPQTNNNASIDTLVESGVLTEFKKRGIRYWLGEVDDDDPQRACRLFQGKGGGFSWIENGCRGLRRGPCGCEGKVQGRHGSCHGLVIQGGVRLHRSLLSAWPGVWPDA
jgi:hypothetical protein